MTVRVVRNVERGHWWNEWLDSRQSFPATGNFDLAANAHGLLMIHNDDVVDPGEGFDTHQHRDMEILTWVLEGTVIHQDSAGNSGMIHRGLAQRMSAGRGILHSERNGSRRSQRQRLRVVQMWVPPDEYGVPPSYEESDVAHELGYGTLVPVASGDPAVDSAIRIGNPGATLHVARLAAGQSVTVPDAPYGHVYLAEGSADFEGHGRIDAGDAVRLTATGGHRVTATAPTEILVWEMAAHA